MILRRISIYGFKSFADKTDLRFGDGMTAVIGPNGCGKTNVVDAIRWVFGEQKTSMLRSTNMQDVIFSGSEKRQPLNMAEVTLNISNTRGILPVEYNEVAITRRIFRSGESEYLINKNPCRLRDIQDLFLDTGIGSNAYTTIENNMINRILSDKAEERRILFEEAAGIGKFKQRIRESQRKLERTGQDLLRINDRVQEKDRYVRMLARQVEKARRYKQYHDDLRSLEVGYENRRYKELHHTVTERARAISELTDEITTAKTRMATIESTIETMELSKIEKENELQIASRNVSDSSEKLNSYDREVSVTNQSLTYLKQNIIRFDNEIESFDTQAAEKSELQVTIEKTSISRQSELQEYETKVRNAQNTLTEFDKQFQMQRQKVDTLAQQQLDLVRDAGEKQKELSNGKTNLNNSLERCERDEAELKRLEEHLDEARLELDNCKQQLQSVSEAFKNHMSTRTKLWDRIEKEDARYHEFVEKEKSLEAKLDSTKSKLRFLEGLDASYEGYGDGVKALLEKKLPGTRGIVADLIEVDEHDMVAIVERALGSTIQTVVYDTDTQLRNAMDYLRAEKVGVARIVSMESLRRLKNHSPVFVVEDSLPMRVNIKTEDACRELADFLFNRILVCASDEAALGIQSRIEADSFVVSMEGSVCYANGSVVAGSKKKEQVGILQRKQEIEQLKVDLVSFKNSYDAIVHDKEICIINRDEAKRALIEIDEKLNSGRQLQQEQETNIKHYEAEIVQLKERIQSVTPEIQKIQTNIEEYRLLISSHEEAIEEITGRRKDLEGQIESARSRLRDMDGERAKHLDHLKNVELSQHGLASRIEQDKGSIEHLKADIKNIGASRQKKYEDKNHAVREIKDLDEKLVVLRETITRQTQERERLREVFEQVREEYNGILNTVEDARKEVKNFQRQLDELGVREHSLEVDQTRDEEHKRAIREKIFNSYEIDLESPPQDIPLIDKEDADVTENIYMLKERLRRVGDVNMGSIGEFEQESNELKEMILQRDDLQTAVEELEQAIKKLNREARVQFMQTFEQVEKNYREMFTTLFEGGEASLSLEEGVDPLDAEIRINARPAGKKMRGVGLLSGGERALTAISLLFALYLVKPSAYCVLDELDAPLDDANVDRFIRVLKKFASKTQFIIITHNKHTMEAADVLYGVTQLEKGVSTVASVVLSEDRQLVAA